MKPTTKAIIIIGVILLLVLGAYFLLNGSFEGIPGLQEVAPEQTDEEKLVGEWTITSVDGLTDWEEFVDAYTTFGSGGLGQLFVTSEFDDRSLVLTFTWQILPDGNLLLYGNDVYVNLHMGFSNFNNKLILSEIGEDSVMILERR